MKAEMTGRERLEAVLHGKKPDRVPWAPLLDGYFTQSLPAQGYPEMTPLQVMEYLDCEYFPRHVCIHKTEVLNCDYFERWAGNVQIRRWTTPVGTIESRYKNTGTTVYCAEHWIKTAADIKIMQYICEQTQFSENYANWLEWNKVVGEKGITPSILMYTGLYKFIEDAGVEAFTYLLADFPNEMEAAIQAHHDANLRLCAIACNSPAELFIIHENTSTQYLSPRWYRRFAAPHFDAVSEKMHGAGKKVFAHMCGHLKGLLPELSAQQLDGYESVCPPTSGNLWAHDALASMPGKIVMGGLEPAALERMTVRETIEYTQSVLEKSSSWAEHFILGTGDATACGTPVENLLAVSKTVRNWKI